MRKYFEFIILLVNIEKKKKKIPTPKEAPPPHGTPATI